MTDNLIDQVKEALKSATPGPWWPSKNSVASWGVETIRDDETEEYAGKAYGANICMAIGDHTEKRTRGNEEANARLIALAPDMARHILATEERLRAKRNEALEEAVKAFEDFMGAAGPSSLDDRLCCDGRECGCYGATERDQILHYGKAAIRALKEGQEDG